MLVEEFDQLGEVGERPRQPVHFHQIAIGFAVEELDDPGPVGREFNACTIRGPPLLGYYKIDAVRSRRMFLHPVEHTA